MERVNLKDDIFIDGFDSELSAVSTGASMWFGVNMELLLYAGKISEIPEELAKECVKNWRCDGLYNNYKIVPQYEEYLFKTAKESIQSACQEEYCIIYKEE